MLESTNLAFFLVLARVGAFIGFFPLFGRQQLPPLVKSGLALALTIFWSGLQPTDAPSSGAVAPLLLLLMIIKEIGIGFALAMLLGLILIPARIAGSYVGQEIGISMEPVTNTGSDQSSVMTTIFEAFTVMLFFVLNIHHFLILFLHYSLDEVVCCMHLFNLPTEGLVGLIGNLTRDGLVIAAPIGVLGFVSLIGLFLLNKAAPSLNLFSIGMPFRVGFGVLIVALLVPTLWRSIEGYFTSMLFEMEAFFAYFRSHST